MSRKSVRYKVWKYQIRNLYGLTPEGFDQMYKSQNGRCAICNMKLKKPPQPMRNRATSACVDHNHTNGLVRGILCFSCNIGLAKFSDDPLLILKAYKYLTEKNHF